MLACALRRGASLLSPLSQCPSCESSVLQPSLLLRQTRASSRSSVIARPTFAFSSLLHGRPRVSDDSFRRLVSSTSAVLPVQVQADEIQQVQDQIKNVASTITAVEQQIAEVESEIKTTNDVDEKKHLRTKETQLRTKETQLRDKETQLRNKETELRKEKNILLQKLLAAQQIIDPFVDLNELIKMLTKRGELRAVRDKEPVLLGDFGTTPLVDRDTAWDVFLTKTAGRYEATKGGIVPTIKGEAVILVAYGGPGSGKTRFLQELMSPQSRTAALAKLNGAKSGPKFDEKFVEAMGEAVAVGITFNHRTDLAPWPGDKDIVSAVALRLFFSHFVNPTVGLEIFARKIAPTAVFGLITVVDAILKDIDESTPAGHPPRQLILCIDETVRGVELRLPAKQHSVDNPKSVLDAQMKEQFDLLLGQIGGILDHYPRVVFAFSSLFLATLVRGSTASNRPIVQLPLFPLSESSVKLVYRNVWEQFTDPIERTFVKKFLWDAAGSPRLLAESKKVVGNRVDSLEALRYALRMESSFANLLPLFETKMFLDAFLLALRGEVVPLRGNDEGIATGLLIMSVPQGEVAYTFLPAIAPSIICCLSRYEESISEAAANKLIQLCRKFFTYSFDAKLYPGGFYEEQFRLFWQIRCLALVARTQKELGQDNQEGLNQNPAEIQQTMNMRKLLGGDKIKCTPLIFGKLFNRLLVVPGQLEMVTSEEPDLSAAGTFWSPTSKTYSGIDGVVTYKTNSEEAATLSFAFQYRFSELESVDPPKTKTPISCESIVKLLIHTCQHECLQESIRQGNFGFVLAGYRSLSVPAGGKADFSDYNVHLQHAIDKQVSKLASDQQYKHKDSLPLVSKLAEQLAILDIEALKRILTPTLAGSLAFSETALAEDQGLQSIVNKSTMIIQEKS